MGTEKNDLTREDIDEIAKLTDGYSGADMKNLCQEASLGPIRSIDFQLIGSIESQEVWKFFKNLHSYRFLTRPQEKRGNYFLTWNRVTRPQFSELSLEQRLPLQYGGLYVENGLLLGA